MNFPKGAVSFLDIRSSVHSFVVRWACILTDFFTVVTSPQILGDWSCTVKKVSKVLKEKHKQKKTGPITLLSALPSLLRPMAGFPKAFSAMIRFVNGF